jgi:hypothetical protein
VVIRGLLESGGSQDMIRKCIQSCVPDAKVNTGINQERNDNLGTGPEQPEGDKYDRPKRINAVFRHSI